PGRRGTPAGSRGRRSTRCARRARPPSYRPPPRRPSRTPDPSPRSRRPPPPPPRRPPARRHRRLLPTRVLPTRVPATQVLNVLQSPSKQNALHLRKLQDFLNVAPFLFGLNVRIVLPLQNFPSRPPGPPGPDTPPGP